jgi:hypothetical protein
MAADAIAAAFASQLVRTQSRPLRASGPDYDALFAAARAVAEVGILKSQICNIKFGGRACRGLSCFG